MKRVVNILGLKDRNGNCYAFSDKGEDHYTLLSEDTFKIAKQVIFFPYNVFGTWNAFDFEKYEWTVLEALVDFKDENQYFELFYYQHDNSLEEADYMLENMKVLLLDEVVSPYKVASTLIRKMSTKNQKSLQNTFERNILNYQIRYGFKSVDDMSHFLSILKKSKERNNYRLPISRFNIMYLEEFVSNGIDLATMWGFENKDFCVTSSDFEYFNQDILEIWMRIYDTVLTDVIPVMNPLIIKEYGVNNLLERMFPLIPHLIETNGYVPDEWVFGDEDHVSSESSDLRDIELEYIINLLEFVTLESIPLLNQLVFEKIEEHIPESVALSMLK